MDGAVFVGRLDCQRLKTTAAPKNTIITTPAASPVSTLKTASSQPPRRTDRCAQAPTPIVLTATMVAYDHIGSPGSGPRTTASSRYRPTPANMIQPTPPAVAYKSGLPRVSKPARLCATEGYSVAVATMTQIAHVTTATDRITGAQSSSMHPEDLRTGSVATVPAPARRPTATAPAAWSCNCALGRHFIVLRSTNVARRATSQPYLSRVDTVTTSCPRWNASSRLQRPVIDMRASSG